MTSNVLKTQALLVLFLLMNSAFMGLQARPLGIIETGNSATKGEVVDFFDWLSLGSIKQSGPSPGVGHKFPNTETLGGIKDSGPSSGGKGHEFTNSETLGQIKDSGPSPGQGH
ncbi:PAMP-induced secreted peptide 2 [Abrus precatorius]|uniref:PAMP-induced secreted peptide 2 n=1 Tax=Abrus precatorius TaxID=3816 RepID=A0A8B8KYW6_ABRPR|nr:PAMP-induced secreted peptide 2 [Abrus precatorius]